MSFVLPGNARELRFTGEVKARTPPRADGAGPPALGKPRLRKPPPPAPAARAHHAPAPAARVPTPAPSRPLTTQASRDHYRDEVARRPYVGAAEPPTARRQDDSVVDDENPTTWMERDALDVLPGAKAIRAPKPSPAFAAPIPHFRAAPLAASEPKMIIIPGTASNKVKTTTSGAPLAVWLLAAVVAGVVSYFVAPELVARLESPAHAASQR